MARMRRVETSFKVDTEVLEVFAKGKENKEQAVQFRAFGGRYILAWARGLGQFCHATPETCKADAEDRRDPRPSQRGTSNWPCRLAASLIHSFCHRFFASVLGTSETPKSRCLERANATCEN